MNNLTIVIPNRSRDLKIVSRTLSSIDIQCNDHIIVKVVDYGSESAYQEQLQELISNFKHIELLLCPTQGQLWNKSRCINLVIKSCNSSHLMVSDMDMIWHPQALSYLLKDANDQINYYQVGFLSKESTHNFKDFLSTQESFKSSNEATGITVFPIKALKEINGFDEYYHGWGSEDSDTHMRCRNAGHEICFNDGKILFKHQWHAKTYRSKVSKQPYHSSLESINHSYYVLNKQLKKVKANTETEWGKSCEFSQYEKLDQPSQFINIYATRENVISLIHGLKEIDKSRVVKIEIKEHPHFKSMKMLMKKLLGNKIPEFISLINVNRILLESIIKNHRNCPYLYKFSMIDKTIELTINLNPDS